MRRIIARAVLSIVKLDVLEAAGSLQLCTGQDAGNEAAVHAMRAVILMILQRLYYWLMPVTLSIA